MFLSKSTIRTILDTESHDPAGKVLGALEAVTIQSQENNDSEGSSAKKQEEPITGVILAGGRSRRMGRNVPKC